ncbi:MAG: ankyrin repeat domain-containing protein [Alphaproteobacteria bacterium]|nr:ankyrin repeat domain-containing protein [Alphaproteobacteria bacterium]
MINIKFPEQDVPNFEARNELVSAVLSLETDAVEKALAKGIDIHMDVARDKSNILTILCATYGEGSEFGKIVCRNKAEKEKLLEMIDFLLKKGVDINKSNRDTDSALSYAAGAGDVEVVKFLHSRGAVPHNLMMRRIRECCHESARKGNLIQNKRYNDILDILNEKSIEEVKPLKRKLSLLKKIAKARVDSEKEGEILPKIEKKNTINLAVAYLKAKAKKNDR